MSASHCFWDSEFLSNVLANILKSLDNFPSSSLFFMDTLVLNSPLIKLLVPRPNFLIGPVIFIVSTSEMIAAKRSPAIAENRSV